jgi:hypothetical protein
MTSYRLTFITPLFSKGSYDDLPEIRPPSIRGQLHWWFRALGGSHAEEHAIFGGVHGGAVASKIVVRVANVTGETGKVATLPHKSGGQASEKSAFLPGTSFDLHLLERLGGLGEARRAAFHRTLEAWLLAGTLGLRATRAGGSFVWAPATSTGVEIDMPESIVSYRRRLDAVFSGTSIKAALLEEAFRTPGEARICVSDTIGGRDDPNGTSDLARLNDPLGRIRPKRKTSPLRFRIVMVGEAFHIVAVWDDRSAVTGNRPGDYEGVVKLLAEKGKRIGKMLPPSW